MTEPTRFYEQAEWLGAKEVFFRRNRPLLLDRLLERRRRFSRVLDCGTGIGALIKHVEPLIEYDCIEGIELDAGLVATAQHEVAPLSNVRVSQGDALALPFEESEFDLVMSQELVEHVPDQTRLMSEMYRVLRPGGTMLCLRNAESEIILAPDSRYPTIEEQVIRNFNQYFLHLKGSSRQTTGSDNRTGRKLWGLATRAGFSEVTVVSDPWLIYPAPELNRDEKAVMEMIVEFLYWSSTDVGLKRYRNDLGLHQQDRIAPNWLEAWRSERLAQVSGSELLLYVNYFSLCAWKPV